MHSDGKVTSMTMREAMGIDLPDWANDALGHATRPRSLEDQPEPIIVSSKAQLEAMLGSKVVEEREYSREGKPMAKLTDIDTDEARSMSEALHKMRSGPLAWDVMPVLREVFPSHDFEANPITVESKPDTMKSMLVFKARMQTGPGAWTEAEHVVTMQTLAAATDGGRAIAASAVMTLIKDLGVKGAARPVDASDPKVQAAFIKEERLKGLDYEWWDWFVRKVLRQFERDHNERKPRTAYLTPPIYRSMASMTGYVPVEAGSLNPVDGLFNAVGIRWQVRQPTDMDRLFSITME